MKKKLSVSVEEDTISEIEQEILNGIYRNKSHLVEMAVNKLLRKENE